MAILIMRFIIFLTLVLSVVGVVHFYGKLFTDWEVAEIDGKQRGGPREKNIYGLFFSAGLLIVLVLPTLMIMFGRSSSIDEDWKRTMNTLIPVVLAIPSLLIFPFDTSREIKSLWFFIAGILIATMLVINQ